MATAQEAIRRLSIQATTSGVDSTATQLEKLADAQNDVAVASDKTEKATLSLENRFASIERRYNAQVRAQQDFDKVQRQVNAAVAQNPALQERANVVLDAARQRLQAVTGGANDNAKAVGLARYELINLSRQAQDVAVSLAGGQSPLTVLFQQGSQIADVFTSSQGTVGGFFKQVTGWLGSFLTAGRVTFGGVATAITGAAFALNSYLNAQQKVNLSLAGAGRASGATSASVNSAAVQGSSLTGFSVSESRELASSIVATGKVANDNLIPIVKMGHDISIAFGTDAAGAAKILSDAFSDPVRGAEQLNQRLGFLDATTRQNISNLAAQNNLYGAQKVLIDAAKSSLADFAAAQSLSTSFWNAIGNSVSNAWDATGKFFSSLTGLGQSLEERLASAKQKLDALTNTKTDYSMGFGINTAGNAEEIAKQRAEVDRLTQALNAYYAAATRAAAAQRSFAQNDAMRAMMPEVGQMEALQNRAILLQGAVDDTKKAIANLVPDEATGERLKILTRALELFQIALGKSQTAVKSFKTDYELALEQQKFQGQALTAFSPSAKGQVAYNETYAAGLRQYNDETKAAAVAEGARSLAIKQATVAIIEQARAQELSARQAVDSAQLEIDMIGKTIGQQAELRANLQARQQLEQQASQNRTAFDQAEYDRLQKINADLGKRAQLAAELAVNDNINFGRQTALLSPEDVSIAQQLKATIPDVTTALNSAQAAGLRTNAAFSTLSSTVSNSLVTGFADIVDGTKSVGQGAADMGKAVLRAINEMIVRLYIVIPLMRTLQSAGSWLGGALGFGATGAASTSTGAAGVGGLGALYADGGYTGPGGKYDPAGIVHRGEYVFDAASTSRIGVSALDQLRGYAEGGYVAPSNVVPFRSAANDSAPSFVVNVYAPAGMTAEKGEFKPDGQGGGSMDVFIKQAVTSAILDDNAKDGPISQAIRGKQRGFGGQ